MRTQRPVLLAIDQEFGERCGSPGSPRTLRSVGSLEVGEHEDVEELDAGSRPEGVQALLEAALKCRYAPSVSVQSPTEAR